MKLLVMVVALLVSTQPVRCQTLGEALNATNLTWTTSGSGVSGWSIQNSVTHDAVSAARSALVSISIQSSTLQTTVTGPGKLTFWWYSFFTDFSTLTFTVNGTTIRNFSSWGIWKSETVYLDSGTQILRWVNAGTTGSGYGYVDEVTFEPGTFAPEIVSQPLTQSQVAGLDAMFTVVAQGTAPLHYQWEFEEAGIAAATNSALVVSNLQVGNLGNYRVVITNAAGAITSSVASLEFGEVAAWGQVDGVGRATVTNQMFGILGIAAGVNHNLALSSNGTVQSWGSDTLGALSVPVGLTNVIGLAADSGSSIAWLPDGQTVVWGAEGYGPTGITNKPASLTSVVFVAAGSAHAVALKSDGKVLAWGNNQSGQTNVPAGLSNVVAIAAGQYHTLAVKADGKVVGWGNNVFVLPQLSNIVAVAAGWYHSLALRSDGTVLSWGNNTFGQTNVPSGLTNVLAIAAGWYFSVALKADGTVVAWGNNQYGQTNVPSGLTNVSAISAEASHALALVGNRPPIISATVTDAALSETGFSAKILSQSGRVYRLEYKTSLADASWTPLPLVAGNGKDLVLTDPSAADAQRFYRVRRW